MNYGQAVNGLRNQTLRAIDTNIQSAKAKYRAAATPAAETKLSGIIFDLLDERERLLAIRFRNLNNRANIASLAAQLKTATKEAKNEAAQISQTTAGITKFTKMLSTVTRLVGLFAAL